MSHVYTPEEIALIRSNAAAAELERKYLAFAMPVIPEANLTPNRERTRRSVNFVYEALGGDLGYAVWASENKTDFYNKHYAKTLERQVEINDKRGIEDYIDIIDGEVVDVTREAMLEGEE